MNRGAPIADAAPPRSLVANLASLLQSWRTRVACVVLFVLAAGTLELAPPCIVRTIVDDHLIVGRSSGLLLLAVLYLGASAAVQLMTFLYGYLALWAALCMVAWQIKPVPYLGPERRRNSLLFGRIPTS